MTIQEKVQGLLLLRNKISEIKKQLEPMQAERDFIQADIIKHMTRQGFDSVKTESATVSKAVRKTVRIVNEDKLVLFLKKRKMNDYVKEQVDRDLWKGLSAQLAKENEIYDGTEINETEFISVRSVKAKGGSNDKR